MTSQERRLFHRDRSRSRDASLETKRRARGRSVEDRKHSGKHRSVERRTRASHSSSQSLSRTRSRNRFRRRRKHKDRSRSYDDYLNSDNDRRKRRRRRCSGRRSLSKRRGSSPPRRRDYDDLDYRARRRRRRSASTSSSSSSPEKAVAVARSSNRRGRRNRRRRRRLPRRRSQESASLSLSSSSNSPPPPPVDVRPRAGVVSDDEHLALHALPKIKPLPVAAVAAATVTVAIAPNKKRGSASSSHDDTVGHFKGREGTIIADRYHVIREVGVGTFGRVLECLDMKRSRSNRRDRHRRQETSGNQVVAIKIVRNVKRYYESALIEADIVEDVNRRGGRGVSQCALMYDTFSFSGHYCMVFEKLGPSLYDFLKRQKYQPFPLTCVRDFAKQLLETLEFLHSFRLIHTDLKPENILLLNDREVSYKGGMIIPECTRIKVIDFGGATYDNEKKSSVVNTRQYRAPEVILGVGWSTPSDLWSVGCILAELYQGELLFATHDNIEHLALIEQVVGPFPRRMLKRAKNTQLANEAFDSAGAHRMERVLTPESLAYVKRIGPLESIVYEEETWFLRLLRRILVTDPEERATARGCLRKF